MKIKYYHSAGFVYDLLFAFSVHYNFEKHVEVYSRFMEKQEAYNYIKNVHEKFGPCSDDLRIFFALQDNGRGFMPSCYFTNQDASELCDISVKTLIEKLENRESVITEIMDFYFPNCALLERGASLLTVISPIIDQSEYDSSIKCDLYSFFVDPNKKIQALIYEIMDKERILTSCYQEEFSKLIELQSDITSSELFLDKIKEYVHINSINENKPLPFTIALLNCCCVWVGGHKTIDFILIGSLYERVVTAGNASASKPDVKTFGEILSEPNRLEMLKIIKCMGEVSQKDLERKLDLTGPTAYYHLSLMQKAKLLKVKNVGRYVFYSLNDEYFEKIISEIKAMYD